MAVLAPFDVRVGTSGSDVELRLGHGTTVRGRLDGFSGDGWRLSIAPSALDAESHQASVVADGSFMLPALGKGEHQLYLANRIPPARAPGAFGSCVCPTATWTASCCAPRKASVRSR